MRSKLRFGRLAALALAAAPAFAQNVLTVLPPDPVSARTGQAFDAHLKLKLKPGYHVNSNKPNDEYLIPLKLTWTSTAVQVEDVVFPKPSLEKYAFSEKPLSVYSGEFELVTRFKALTRGMTTVAGKLRYQACNSTMCLPPKTIDIQLPVQID